MSGREERVVLVDSDDRVLGEMEKLLAHRTGRLHRALSVFVFNSRGELLLQQRSLGKYHSGGLWTNTCCSHPRPGEAVQDAAVRRLGEEMGLQCPIEHRFAFVYRSELDHGLIEHEFDHVFIGHSDAEPEPDPSEVSDWRYASAESIRSELIQDPGRFTSWFRICFESAVEAAQVVHESGQISQSR
jgi:isopentenyl-diphosphate delta-isomerase